MLVVELKLFQTRKYKETKTNKHHHSC